MASDETLSRAAESLNRGDLSAAEDLCQQVLRHCPDNARAWQLCGVIHAQRADLDQALRCFEKAVQYDPENATCHYNLALACRGLGDTQRAVGSYRAALARRADFTQARNNLGNALMALGQTREAIECFGDLIEMAPQSSDAHFNLANLLADTGNVDQAIVHYRRALELRPDFPAARENLGKTLTDCGHPAEARQLWKEWLEQDPDNAVARHMLASISGENAPRRCADDYIRETFDRSFAQTYDQQLARIRYQGPALIRDAIARLASHRSGQVVLDAGCGTGLCGPMVRELSRHLVGVDLCEDMLVEARKRGIYDQTIAGEIAGYMMSCPQTFDLIISSDTLCYFGDLDEVLRAAHHCLRDNGNLIFTVESAPPGEQGMTYQLRPSGRYCHAEQYVDSSLRNAGLCPRELTHAVLRTERGVFVDGMVVTASRGPASFSKDAASGIADLASRSPA
jgi:predicted TPR repeat methyltransferase